MKEQVMWRMLAVATLLAGATENTRAQATNHPLAGVWTGYVGRSEASPTAAKFEFKVTADGSVGGIVTGPELTAGDIKNVAFDRATGSLRFSVVIHDVNNGAGGNVSFDGRLARDTASGKMILGKETGVFRFMRPSASQTVTPQSASDASAVAKRGFTEVSGWITRAAELVPADRYTYRPIGTVRTYGQMIAHIVDGSRYYCGRGAGRNVQWADAAEKGALTKATLTAALKQAFADCAATYASGGQIAPLMENIGHSSLHYGNLVTYIRMMGLVPPSA